MTRNETKEVVMAIYNLFPNWKPSDLSFTVDTWNVFLSEYDKKEVQVALATYVKSNTSGFAPSVGQLIQLLPSVIKKEESLLNEAEAWSLVRKAIRKSSYYAEEEYQKLPEAIKKAIGSPSNLRVLACNEDYNEEVESSNFKRAYRTVLAREKEIQRMPKQIQDLIGTVVKEKQEKYNLGVTTTATTAIEQKYKILEETEETEQKAEQKPVENETPMPKEAWEIFNKYKNTTTEEDIETP